MGVILQEGERVKVENPTGDRRRFEGRSGEVVRVQERLHPAAAPFVHVWLDGSKRSFVFMPYELVPWEPERQ